MHHEHLFDPAFEQLNDKGVFTTVIAGRFELLAVPPHLCHNLALTSGPAAPVDELLWLGKSELWNEMFGCCL